MKTIQHFLLLSFIFYLVLLPHFSIAQEKNAKDIKNKTTKAKNPDSPQAEEGDIKFTDGTPSVLLRITDEGNFGAIELKDGVPGETANKLYNDNGTLKFHQTTLGGGSASEINDLGDAIYDGSSLFIGNGAGGTQDDGNNSNVAVGKNALTSNQSGFLNVAIGNNSLEDNIDGEYNTAVGFESLATNSSGSENTGNGYQTLTLNTTGLHNTACGASSLRSNTTGKWNSASGSTSLVSNISGTSNTAVGYSTMAFNSTGNNNVSVGFQANVYNETGSNNTIIGSGAGQGTSSHSKSGNILIGYQSGFDESGNNKLYIENSNSSSPLIWGDFATDDVKINGNFSVNGINGVLFEGADGGSIPKEGAGKRMMWYRNKYAFRAGGVTSDQWDDGNIGNYSTALGNNTTASGNNSFAVGNSTNASGFASSVLGFESVASGNYSLAIGYQAISSMFTSISLGTNTTASANYSTALGQSTTASGNHSTALGQSTTASGNHSTALGQSTTASGSHSASFGDGTQAIGNKAVALGQNTIAEGTNSTSMGNGTRARASASLALGKFNVGTGTSGNWISADPVFEIGNGTDDANRSNIFTIHKNGNVGIGVFGPSYQLELSTNSAGKPGGGSWTNTSDQRLKNVLGEYEKGLDEIEKIRTVKFRYKKDNPRNLPNDSDEFGFIAQEIKRIFPEAVSEGKDGYLDFNMHPINVAMVNAVQELSKQNSKLVEKVNELENLVQSLIENKRFTSVDN